MNLDLVHVFTVFLQWFMLREFSRLCLWLPSLLPALNYKLPPPYQTQAFYKERQVTCGWFTVFQVVCVVHNFKGSQMLSEDTQQEDVMSSPRVESPLEKYIASQVQHSCICLH